MNLKAFMMKYVDNSVLLSVAEKILPGESGIERKLEEIWNKHVNAEELRQMIERQMKEAAKAGKKFPYPSLVEFSTEQYEDLVIRILKGEIESDGWNRQTPELLQKAELIGLIDRVFWEKVNGKSKDELIALLISQPDFSIYEFMNCFESEDLQRISDDLEIDNSDLDPEGTFRNNPIQCGRILAKIQPDALAFDNLVRADSHHWPWHMWWDERDRRIEALYQEMPPNHKVWLQEQSEFQKWLESNFSFTSKTPYIFHWISLITENLDLLSKRISKLESVIDALRTEKT